jgi:hypothetical protein
MVGRALNYELPHIGSPTGQWRYIFPLHLRPSHRTPASAPCLIHPPPPWSPPPLQGPYLPGYTATPDEPAISYGLQRLDHAVGNVHKLVEALEHIIGFTGVCFRGGGGEGFTKRLSMCESASHV